MPRLASAQITPGVREAGMGVKSTDFEASYLVLVLSLPSLGCVILAITYLSGTLPFHLVHGAVFISLIHFNGTPAMGQALL